jgi:TonB family protein
MATWQNPSLPAEPSSTQRLRPVLVSGPNGSNMPLFQQVTAKPPRNWRSFLSSYALEIVGIALLAHFGVIAPQTLAPRKTYTSIELYTPKPTETAPAPVAKKITAPPRVLVEKITPKVELPKPEITPPPPPVVAKVEPPPVPTPEPPKPMAKVETGKFDSAPAPVARGNPTKEVETGVFSGSSAKPTLQAKVSQVQTGGFGDPNGVPVGKQTSATGVQIAKVGSFDLPGGPGEGNGTGGAKGMRGTVASAGFGNGVAGPGNGDHGGSAHGSVKTAGFGDQTQPGVREVKHDVSAPAQAALVPVEILDKPKPNYTAEARQLKIEGEVLLQVVFTASGQIEVVKVVRGLGHGLDEAAVAAAQKIRFKPAQRSGQAVDYPATIHIVFQIA